MQFHPKWNIKKSQFLSSHDSSALVNFSSFLFKKQDFKKHKVLKLQLSRRKTSILCNDSEAKKAFYGENICRERPDRMEKVGETMRSWGNWRWKLLTTDKIQSKFYFLSTKIIEITSKPEAGSSNFLPIYSHFSTKFLYCDNFYCLHPTKKKKSLKFMFDASLSQLISFPTIYVLHAFFTINAFRRKIIYLLLSSVHFRSFC